MDFLSLVLPSISQFFSEDPSVFLVQVLLLGLGFVVVFLVLFTTRDVLLRYDSFIAQVLCILLVATLPVFGFLFYLLIRPSMTTAEKHLRHDLEAVLQKMAHGQSPKKHQQHQHEKQKKS